MLGNGKCDSACNTPECMYDKDDCPCNPGCSYLDFPSCKAACLVPSCHYGNHGHPGGCQDQFLLELTWATQALAKDHTAQFDMKACQQSDPQCTPALLQLPWSLQACDKDHEATCQTTQCVFALGFCVKTLDNSCARGYGKPNSECFECKPGYVRLLSMCLEYCPWRYERTSDNTCVPKVDTTTIDTPSVLYVSESKLVGNGSLSWPFANLGLPLISMWQQYTTIYLLGQSVLLDIDFSSTHPEVQTYKYIGPASSRLVRISSLPCDQLRTEGCSLEYTEIGIVTPFTLYIDYTLIMEHVVVTSKVLFAGLSTDFCPTLILVGDVWVMENGQPASTDYISAARQCEPFRDYSAIVVKSGGTLILREMEVANLALEARALVNIRGGIVQFESVNFRDVHTQKGEYKAGIVLVDTSCSDLDCGSFSYINGRVESLNQGLTYVEGLLLSPFLYASTLRDVVFANVTFEHNFVVDAFASTDKLSSVALISLDSFHNLTIANCTFRANFVTGGVVVVDSWVVLPKLSDSNKTAYMYAYPHITLRNLLFESNLGEASLVTIRFQKDVLNVNVSALVFLNNAVEGYGLLAVQSDRAAKSALAYGEVKSVRSATTGKLENMWIGPRYVSISDVNITKTMSAASLIIVENCANIKLNSLNIVENGDLDESVLNRTFEIYAEGTNTQLPVFPSPAECAHFLYFKGNIETSLQRISLSANLCTQGICGAYIHTNTGTISVSDLTARDNLCTSPSGSILTVFDNTNIRVLRVSVVNHTNWSGGVLSFGTHCQVSLQTSLFQDNSGADGAAVACEAVASLVASQLTFKNNSAAGSIGAGLYILAGNSLPSLFTLTDCQFEGNSADRGGALAFVATNDTTISLHIASSQFRSNTAVVFGAALMVAAGLTLQTGSKISDCLFAGQGSDYGAVTLAQKNGFLDFVNCVFQGNRGKNSAAVFLESEDPALTTFTNVKFIESVGKITILDANSRFNTSFITKNCTFLDNEGSDMVMEGGYWQDFGSTFVFSTYTEFYISSLAVAAFKDTLISNNHADYQGGAVHLLTGGVLHCDNCLFLNNSAGHSGGAIFAEQDSTIIVRNSLFHFNSANQNGAVLQLISSVGTTSLIESSLIEWNSVGNLGVIFMQSAFLVLSNVTLRSNVGSKCPGIMLMLASLQVVNSRFSEQVGALSAFLMAMTSSNVTIVGSRFWDGDTEDGGGISISSSALNISETDLHSLHGGAIFANDICTVTLEGVKMTNITLATEGSLIDALYSSLYILHSQFSDFHEIGIFGFEMAEVVISASSFTDGKGKYGAAFQCYQCDKISITQSVFENLQAETAGALATWAQNSAFIGTLTIVDTSFVRNVAETAGAVWTSNYHVSIINSRFEENRAGVGAGLVLDCVIVSMCSFSISDSVFLNNSAEVKGGGIAWTIVKPQLTNLTFSGNVAQYGSDVASYPIGIVLDSVSGRGLQSALLPNYPTGQLTNNVLFASLRDHYGQVYTIDNSSIATLGAVDISSSVLGTFKATAQQGTFLLDSFIIYGPPGSAQKMNLRSSAISPSQPGDPDPHISSVLLTVELRDCEPGEYKATYSCEICAAGTYSFDPSTLCLSCLGNAQCWGNFTVTPEAGYWRSNEFSHEIRPCPKQTACLGGEVEGKPLSLTGYCLDGYEGNLCQACQKDYSRTGKNLCSKCPDSDMNVIRLIFIGVALILVLAIMVWSTLRASTRPKAEHTILIKIMTNYLQLVTLVIGFKLKWPQAVEDAFVAQNSVGGASQQFFSFDCLIGSDISQEETYYRKMIIMAFMPLLLIVFSVLSWMGIAWWKKSLKQFGAKCAATIIIIFFLILPNLVDSMFSLFSCQEIEAGENWLTVDLSIRCWNGTHTLYMLAVGVPGVIVWVFGVPLICVGVLTKYRRRQDEIWLKMQYGFLLSGYTRHCFYWEFVILYRKVLIIICAVFINSSIPLQALTIQIVLLVAFFLQLRVQPYTTPQLNMTETLAILVADVTIYCGLYYLTMQLSYVASWVLFIIIVATNIVFLLYWITTLLRSVWPALTSLIPALNRIFRPGYFYDKEIERFLDLFTQRNTAYLASFPLSLSSCMRKLLPMHLPIALHRQVGRCPVKKRRGLMERHMESES